MTEKNSLFKIRIVSIKKPRIIYITEATEHSDPLLFNNIEYFWGKQKYEGCELQLLIFFHS